MYKKEIKKILEKAIEKSGYKLPDSFDVQLPRDESWGDWASNIAFILKNKKENPQEVAKKIVENIKGEDWLEVKVEKSGYINFLLKDDKLIDNLSIISKKKDEYGKSDIGKGKTVVIDYSSPNIAKPFSIGHFRATIIGQAVYNICKFLGYDVVGDNHLGDWGTQFGKLLTAYVHWGDRSKIEKNPIKEFYDLYVRFHNEVEKDSELEVEARSWFKRLEEGDKEARDIWKWTVKLSMDEFSDIYDMLGVSFDEILGESFYEDKMDEIIEICEKNKIAKWEKALDKDGKKHPTEKVLLIDLSKQGYDTPALLKKSDGTTLYMTRDLAAARYRIKKWDPEKILYAVGNEQKLYFKQLFKVLEMMGEDIDKFEHVGFGFMRLADGRMSTRKGRTVFIRDVIDEVVKRAQKFVSDENISQYDKDEISKKVGIGAIKYADLMQNRTQDVIFDYDKIMNLKGNSGPYLQYTYARAKSVLRKAEVRDIKIDEDVQIDDIERKIMRKLAKFDDAVLAAGMAYMPNYIANYLYELANEFNSFYQKAPIIGAEDNKKNLRLAITDATTQVLKNGLGLLGIETLEKM